MVERTFVMIKPDGVARGLIGEIISTFEKTGLKIIELDMRHADRQLVTAHYPSTEDWFRNVGNKTLKRYIEMGLDPISEIGFDDPVKIGMIIKDWLIIYITSGNVVAIVLEGFNAVFNVRRLCGDTMPINADPGSIRGKYGLDSPDIANREKRPIYNLIHASENITDAKYEINLWFPNHII